MLVSWLSSSHDLLVCQGECVKKGLHRGLAEEPAALIRPPIGHTSARGQKGTAHAYNLKSQRDQERRWVEQAEAGYARFVAGWNARGPKARTGAAKEERQ